MRKGRLGSKSSQKRILSPHPKDFFYKEGRGVKVGNYLSQGLRCDEEGRWTIYQPVESFLKFTPNNSSKDCVLF